jgi:acetyl-CoA carboxylase biotin carboxyl carrier protein
MNPDFIEALIGIMQRTGLAEIELEDGGLRLRLSAASSGAVTAMPVPDKSAEPAETPDTPLILRAPMAGTFYRAPSPGAAPFVTEGAEVADGQTLALMEAMKMLSPVEAAGAVRILKIHVENATLVARGDPLFTLEPLG